MTWQRLDGIWNFAYCASDDFCTRFDSCAAVPSCFDASSALFSQRGVGWYRRFVEIAGPVCLRLRGGLALRVFWDGVLVGQCQLPYSPFECEFEAGDFSRHELLIAADNRLRDDPAEQFHPFYDFYGYGGIYDHVEICPLKDGIRRVEVLPLSHRDGTVKIRLECGNSPPDSVLLTFDGEPAVRIPYMDEFEYRVPEFRLWTPQTPHLHTLRIDDEEVRFGLRTIRCQGSDLLLNGEKIKLVGYNRHEAHPQFGAATPDALTIEDIRKIKSQGCNFIRGCHYPQKEAFLDACDRLGMLVWEEALGWGNREEHLVCPEFQQGQLEACRQMLRRSINHPSVIIWGFLNENASDKTSARPLVSRLAESIRAMDPSRPVTFASNRCLRDCCFDLVDIISLNTYPGWYSDFDGDGVAAIRPALEKLAAQLPEKPLLISEIGVGAMSGDHSECRWSEEYQAKYLLEVLNCIFAMERFAGVALWQYCDTKTYINTVHFLVRPRGFNNKGVLNEYRIPKLAWREISKFLADKKADREKSNKESTT
jgi:beta-glucuronidase